MFDAASAETICAEDERPARNAARLWETEFPAAEVFEWEARRRWLAAALRHVRELTRERGLRWPSVRVLPALPPGRAFAGLCVYRRPGAPSEADIYLSDRMTEPQAILTVLIHEIAHAIAPHAGHGTGFRRTMADFGFRSTASRDDPRPALQEWLDCTAGLLGPYPRVHDRGIGILDPCRWSFVARYVRWCPDCGGRRFFVRLRDPDIAGRRDDEGMPPCGCRGVRPLQARLPAGNMYPDLPREEAPDFAPIHGEAAAAWLGKADSRVSIETVRGWCVWTARAIDGCLVGRAAGVFAAEGSARRFAMRLRRAGTVIEVGSLPLLRIASAHAGWDALYATDLSFAEPFRNAPVPSGRRAAGAAARLARCMDLSITLVSLRPVDAGVAAHRWEPLRDPGRRVTFGSATADGWTPSPRGAHSREGYFAMTRYVQARGAAPLSAPSARRTPGRPARSASDPAR